MTVKAEEQTVEIIDAPEVKVEESSDQVALSDLLDSGFNEKEIEEAKGLGMVKSEEKPKVEAKKEEAKSLEVVKPTEEEYKAAWDRAQLVDDPAKEAEKTKDFTLNEKQLWKAQKIAFARTKTLEAEREHARKEVEKERVRAKALEEKLKALDPDYVEEVEKKDEDAERNERAQVITRRLNTYEEEARGEYHDFDEVMVLTHEVLKEAGTLFKDSPRSLSKVRTKYAEFLKLVSSDVGPGEYSAADVAYEIGQMHPKFGKQKDVSTTQVEDEETAPKAEKVNVSPKKVEKANENSKRLSSASIASGGGSRRVVSYDDLTVEDADKLSPQQFDALPKHVQERLLGKP